MFESALRWFPEARGGAAGLNAMTLLPSWPDGPGSSGLLARERDSAEQSAGVGCFEVLRRAYYSAKGAR